VTTVKQPSTEERLAAAPAGAFAITVSFELEEGAAEKFHCLVAENARQSVALEPGCLRFDVLFPTNGATGSEVFLYEIYANPAAFDIHLASPHFKSFDEETRALVRKKTVNAFTVDQNAK
jgi:autoinducer 2-degrading protein